MRKPVYAIRKQQRGIPEAHQTAWMRRLISAFVAFYLDSRRPTSAKSNISRLWLVSRAEHAGLFYLEDRFSRDTV